MITPMTKVHIGVPIGDKQALLSWLQNEELVHITPLVADQANPETDTEYLLARVQFALEFILRLRKETGIEEKKSWRNMFVGKPVASLDDLNATLEKLQVETVVQNITTLSDTLGKLTSDMTALDEELALLQPWSELPATGAGLAGTDTTAYYLVSVGLTQDELFLRELGAITTATWQEIRRITAGKTGTVYYEVVVARTEAQQVDQLLQTTNADAVTLDIPEASTIADHATALREQRETHAEEYAKALKTGTQFIEQEKEVQLVYDGLLHRAEREQIESFTSTNTLSFVLGGWLPTHVMPTTEKRLRGAFPDAAIETVDPEEGEDPPVSFKNSALITPFEAVTDIFGKPRYSELDPTPALSLFFLVSFGLALTDAGYGIVLMLGTLAAERVFKLKTSVRKMTRLLFYAGLFTTIIGAMTGGWFGLTLEELPQNGLVQALLAIKLIDPISSPITLLMAAFAIGIVQLLFAWGVNGYDLWRRGERNSAILDAGAWITMIIAILTWVAAGQGVLPAVIGKFALYCVYINAAVLILSQGREHKNPLLRLGSGVISLYGLISFLSDVLSYSRLLALGLATGIIGLVVNLIGGMVNEMIPVVGIFLAVIVLIGGHAFNLGINAFGAFIHSARLQFVEFFPKFMEGGGEPYRPLGRVSKYVDNPNDYA